MSGGPGKAPYGATARFVFTPPPGTSVQRFRGSVEAFAWDGWHAGIVDSTPRWVWGGGPYTTWENYNWVDIYPRTGQLFIQVTCGNTSGCPRNALLGYVYAKDLLVTVEDNVAPNVAITGGSVTRGGWRNGDQSVSFAGSDATGIRHLHALRRRPASRDVSRLV